MPRIVLVQRHVSQIDESVYALMHQTDANACSVLYIYPTVTSGLQTWCASGRLP
jgi:hypothetical protein